MNLKLTTVAALAALLGMTTTHAIPGLEIKVQCEDVILSWPSSDTNNEYYLIQHRPTLDLTNQWETIASWYPADVGTNRTHYVHVGAVQNPPCQNGMFLMSIAPISYTLQSEGPAIEEEILRLPLAIRADGTGSAVPLCLYPPGFDLSPFLIIDPLSGESLSGEGLTTTSYSVSSFGLDPSGEPTTGEGAGISDPPVTGFYRVVRQGVNLLGLTDGTTLSGVVTIQVEAGNESGTLTSLSINEGGSPISDLSTVEAPFNLPLMLTVDTTQMSNGVHQVYASGSWYVPGANNPYVDLNSSPITINVFNEISFPNWMPLFGQLYDAVYITAQSAHADADWYIDVYGGESGYIGTFGGHTYDGNIEVYWDLVGPPPNFPSYTDEPYFQFVVETVFNEEQLASGGFQTAQAAGGASAVSPPTKKNYDRWTSPGDWVVANQTFWNGWVGDENLNTMTDAFAQMGEQYGRTVRPAHPFGEAFRIQYNTGAEVGNWTSFRQALYHPNSRNLFYSGHGGNNGIGYDSANTNVYIKRSEIESVLKTTAGSTNRHAFRFVFLDGCQTAKGNLSEAFGIIRKENLKFDHYVNSGERFSAFVGWNESPTAGYAGRYVSVDHWKFIQNFQYNWTSGMWPSLRDALDHAAAGPLGNADIDPDDLTVYGYRDLGPNQHNGN